MASPTISVLLASAEAGDRAAVQALFAALYEELHRLAARELARQGKLSPLGVTTLLHEAYLDITRRDGVAFPDRARFMSYAARVMRGLIIDHARRHHSIKRGGLVQFSSDTTVPEVAVDGDELSRIGDALDELALADAALAELVDLKFFCGFSSAEIAAMRGVSERTIQRDWEKARIYLHRALGEREQPGGVRPDGGV